MDNRDRQVKIILALEDPLAINNPQLPPVLLNDFVEVQLSGKLLADTFQINSRHLNESDEVWVVNNNELQKRSLNVLYHGREVSWVTPADGNQGFQPGDQLLISNIDAPVVGYPVRILRQQETDNNSEQPGLVAGEAK